MPSRSRLVRESRTKPMGKTVRQILAPELVKRIDRLLEGRERSKRELQEERQRNDVLLKPDGGVDVTNAEAQQGRRLHRSEVVRRILKLNPNLWYERSIRYPDQGGLYVRDLSVLSFEKRRVASMPHDWVPEFSVQLTVPSIVPSADLAPVWEAIQQVDSRIPGWRMVLVCLLKEGLISPAGIEREFQISRGRSSQKWQAVTN